MPKAEFGSTKHLANQMKSKGLQRLRWWCEICSKQTRDANGFKCHVQSESHVRKMQAVGENPQKYIQQFSNDFQRDFVSLLRITHGEKYISINRFYNEYIRDKEHVHMNSTRWASLTEFAKHLGREGIVTVKEDEKDGLCIAWRDVSAAAVKRREEIRELELAEARSGAGEDKLLKRMAKRAREEADEKARILEARKAAQKITESPPADGDTEAPPLEENKEGETAETEALKPEVAPAAPIKISFGLKTKVAPPNKAGLGKMNSQSVFKRARTEASRGEAPKKRIKL
jgi:DNA/RNA-binding protein KIN17